MIGLGAIVVAVGVLSAPLTPPMPLTDVQREMLTSGMFEANSFHEPAFEALVENVRSWPDQTETLQSIDLYTWGPESIAQIIERNPGSAVVSSGEVMMIDPVGDAFPGVTRATLRIGNRMDSQALLVFIVDGPAPEIGRTVTVVGRAYKVMPLQTQANRSSIPFPAMVGRIDPLLHIAHASASPMTGAAIVTALTGALAVVFFVVIMGRHMLGKNRPQRRSLASTSDPSDDLPDA